MGRLIAFFRYLLVRVLKRDGRVRGPMIRGKGKLGPEFPVNENPYDLIFEDLSVLWSIRGGG